MKTIICVSGKMQSGKDMFAQHVINKYGFTKIFFANRLKQAVCDIHGWSMEDMESQDFKQTVDPEWNYSPREALQVFGTETMRKFFPKKIEQFTKRKINLNNNIWVKGVDLDLRKSDKTKFISTDLRFKNEFDYFYNMKLNPSVRVIMVRIEASYKKFPPKISNNKFIKFFQLLLQKQHISEYDLDSEKRWDYIINNSTLEKFIESINEFCKLYIE